MVGWSEKSCVLDTDLAERLGYRLHEDICKIVRRKAAELGRYGIVAKVTINTGKRGRPGTAFYLNEEQALLVCIWADTSSRRSSASR